MTVFIACLFACAKEPTKQKLNLVVISVDTLRADHLSCYGYPKKNTPNIDLLAEKSIRFEYAFTSIPSTLPAHASLFTSLYPHQLASRRNGEVIPKDATLLAEILKEKGYDTGAVVSASVLDGGFGLDQGFMIYDDVSRRKNRTAGETLVQVKAWLDQRSKKPFFLFAHLFDPHTYYDAPKEFYGDFIPGGGRIPPFRSFLKKKQKFNPEKIKDSLAGYDAEIAYADWAVGEILKHLETLKFSHNTLVAFVSDHGEALDELIHTENFAFGHGGFLYPYIVRIPLILHIPGMDNKHQPAVIDTPVSIIDVMPTVLDLLKITPPDRISGQSLLPMVQNNNGSHGPIFMERRFYEDPPKDFLAERELSVISDQWLFIDAARRDELFNLKEDPSGKNNLIEKHARIESIKKLLQGWRKNVKPLFGPANYSVDHKTLKKLEALGYTK